MQTNLIVKLMTGAERRGTLSREFDPDATSLDLLGDREQQPVTYPLGKICYIKFLGKPDWAVNSFEDEFIEDVTTTTGEQFHLRLKKGEPRARGFFGYPTEVDSDFQCIFFTNGGVRGRRHDLPIGQVLHQEGLVKKAQLHEALEEQQRLRQRRVGEIIVEQTAIPQTRVDQAVKRAHRNTGFDSRSRVGDILIEAGLVTRKQVDEALASQATGKRKRIGTILVERGLITEDQLLNALARKFGLRIINLDETEPDPAAIKRIPPEMIERMQVLPIELRGNRLVVATSMPTDPTISENLRFATDAQVELVVASASQIGGKIARLVSRQRQAMETLLDEMDIIDVVIDEEPEVEKVTESDSKVINLVNKVLLDAHQHGVSDIHFEPGLGTQPLRVRYRKDGICYTLHQIATTYKAAVIARIKIIAKLDIAERRRPQSGKIMLKHGRERIEYRVEITPTVGGQEDAVLRVLTSACVFPLDQIGFSARNLGRFKELLTRPYGIILCVGPTGSGKTTSLHAALAEINQVDKKIWTAEDPVEITQEGLRQVQVHTKIGFTFEEALRSFLRADPDVIMIGEMRDPSTAKTAIGASLTGHLVFSTLHTNNAPETVVRLIEMGMDPFNFSDAMLGIMAQRLARRLCGQCKEPYHPTRTEYDDLVAAYGAEAFERHELPKFSDSLTLMKAVGCDACDGQGYSGRIAIHELLVNSPGIKQAIKRGAAVEEINQLAIEQGMTTLRMDGIQKVFLGITDLSQINRVCS